MVIRTHKNLIDLAGRRGMMTHLYNLYKRTGVLTPYEFKENVGQNDYDAEAIQMAHDAIAALGGGRLYLPGLYRVGETLRFNSPSISVIGDGSAASEIRSLDGSGTALIDFHYDDDPGNPTNWHGKFEGIKVTHLAGTWTNMVRLRNLNALNLIDIWIEGAWSTGNNVGLLLESALSLSIYDCHFRYGNEYAVDVGKIGHLTANGHAYPNHVKFYNSSFKRGKTFGLRFRAGESLIMMACDFQLNGDPDSITIDHGGFLIDEAGEEAGGGLCADLYHCWFESNNGAHARVGTHAFGAGGTRFTHCKGLGTGALSGIYCDVTSPDRGAVEAVRCTFQNAADYDFHFLGDSAGTLTDCNGTTNLLTRNVTAIPIPSNSGQSQTDMGRLSWVWDEWAHNGAATTVDVSKYGPNKYANNTSATSYRTLTGASDGAKITIKAGTGYTTLVHRYSGVAGTTDEIDCPGNANFTIPAGTAIELIREHNRWTFVSYPQQIVLPGGVLWSSGSGSPESAVTAPIGSMYSRTNGGAGTSLYIKESGTGNTGWVGK